MKLKTFGIAAIAALSLFSAASAADSSFVYDKTTSALVNVTDPWKDYTAIVVQYFAGPKSEQPITVSAGIKSGDKETALEVDSGDKILATIDMDGTIHAETADVKDLMKAIYLLSQQIGTPAVYQPLHNKMPALEDLK